MRVSKKAKRDTAKKAEIHRLRRRLGMFAESLVTNLYLEDEAEDLYRCGISNDEILDRFILEENGSPSSAMAALLEEKMGGVIRKAINAARGAGVPLVPVVWEYFQMDEDDLACEIEDHGVKHLIAGLSGGGSKSWGCRYICDSDEVDPFFTAWHEHLVSCTNGMTNAVKEVVSGAKTQHLPGFGANSNVVKKTLAAEPLRLPK